MKFKKISATAGALALVLMGGPAYAAAPALVGVDNDYGNVDHPYTAVSKGMVALSTGTVTMGCTSISASGDILGGFVSAGEIASIKVTSWTGCLGPLSQTMVVNMNPAGSPTPWTFIGVDGATAAVNDVIEGYVDGIDFTMTSSGFPCAFDVVGTADAQLHERVLKAPGVYGQELVIDESSGNLVLDGVTGCFGLLSDGDPFHMAAMLNVKVAGAVSQTPINVRP